MKVTEVLASGPTTPDPGLGGRLALMVRRLAVWFALLLLLVLGAVLSPAFLTVDNLLNVLRPASIVGIAAIGATYVVLIGGVDVSNAAVITASAAVATAVMGGKDEGIVPAIIASLAVGVAIGLTNGFLVARWRVNPFILTIGMGVVVLGATLVFTGGTSLGNVAPLFRSSLSGRIAGIPTLGVVFLLFAAVGIAIQRFTPFGARLYLVGANRRAAALSGVRVDAVVVGAYTLSAVTASLAGLVYLARSGPPSNFTGMGIEFQVLAAVVLGGTTFAGGIGGVGGTVAGAYALAISLNLVNIVGLGTGGQLMVQGAVIVGVAALYARLRPRG